MKELPTNICPLRAIAPIGATDGPAVCIEERCAWWDGNNCAMLSLAESIGDLNTGGIITHPQN